MNETTTLETAVDHVVDHSVDHGHDDHAHDEHHDHPSDRNYVIIALILGFFTALEVSTYFFEEQVSSGLLIAGLTILMVVKFAIVGFYFMHLKFDSKVYTWMFGAGIAFAIIVYFIMLFASNFFG